MGYLGSSINDGEKITLDQKTFKVLASETRIGILKKLDKTQMTVSDLARALGMSKATLFEHLEKMIEAGLIKKKEDERKWVYYKLSWKGKNILHPERTKIAIVLTVVIVSFIILGYLVLLNSGYDISNLQAREQDTIAPTINFSKVEDITDNTNRPVEIKIDVDDNQELDESTLRITYAFSESYVKSFAYIGTAQEIQGTITQGEITIILDSINWSTHSENYLYIRCTIADKAGNYAQKTYVEFIERIYYDSKDLSIQKSDVTADVNIFYLREGFQTVPMEIKIHNTGSLDIQNVELAIYSLNPDSNDDGIADNFTSLITTRNIDFIKTEGFATLELNLMLNVSQTTKVWIVLDPDNIHNESNEKNNILKVDFLADFNEPYIPEFPIYIGICIGISIILIYSLIKKNKYKKRY